MVMKMKKIMEYLQHYINQYPHRLALVFEDRHLTYGELSKEIYQASMRYKEVKLNKKVGLMDEHPVNILRYIKEVEFLAFLIINGVMKGYINL